MLTEAEERALQELATATAAVDRRFARRLSAGPFGRHAGCGAPRSWCRPSWAPAPSTRCSAPGRAGWPRRRRSPPSWRWPWPPPCSGPGSPAARGPHRPRPAPRRTGRGGSPRRRSTGGAAADLAQDPFGVAQVVGALVDRLAGEPQHRALPPAHHGRSVPGRPAAPRRGRGPRSSSAAQPSSPASTGSMASASAGGPPSVALPPTPGPRRAGGRPPRPGGWRRPRPAGRRGPERRARAPTTRRRAGGAARRPPGPRRRTSR